jgi:antitoxin YefM
MTMMIPLADAKARLSAVLDDVRDTHDRVVITRNGRPEAVIISVSDLETLEETLDLLSTPGALDEIRAAEAETRRRAIPWRSRIAVTTPGPTLNGTPACLSDRPLRYRPMICCSACSSPAASRGCDPGHWATAHESATAEQSHVQSMSVIG